MRIILPKTRSLHRQAAIALFRALLSQCRALPIDETLRGQLQNVVRHRFRANRSLQGTRRIQLSFEAGYTAIDLLDEAVAGDVESTGRIQDYLERVPDYMKRAPKPKPLPVKELPHPTALFEPPPEKKFLNVFPRKHVEGIRKVPNFVNASQLPFLRWKKPQPENVSRVIRDLYKQRIKRLDYVHQLQDYYIPLAQYEEDWDMHLKREFGAVEGSRDREGWVKPMKEVAWDIERTVKEKDEKSQVLMGEFLDIVKREKELAGEEKEDRKRKAKERRAANKRDALLVVESGTKERERAGA
ncbi:hypothetical protein EJ08DRAFT_696813 [Tothia fuscella]|uniref:Complex 1 LYR protein domain-containing protein n=1 Tax=Tothia fuscella TaxID=1048955 RepID=A0A9P4NS41_9PEZI|nr:hypothetical protein EJ08DRAFT_696813 [Tothia fuscella]